MFTAKSYEAFTLLGFVRTSWLIGKRVTFLHFFKVITRLRIYCASLFSLIFNKKIVDYHVKLCMIASYLD